MDKVVSLPLKQRRTDESSISLEARDDDALMLMARAGVEGAFSVLVRRHQRTALGVAVKYLGDPVWAQDIAQNSFLDVYRHIDTYRPEGKFRSFLARIVINQCRMARRRARSEARTCQGYQTLQESAASHAAVIERREQRRLLDEALRNLSPKLREVLILRYSAELSHREISEALGIRVGTVKSRLFAGVEKLSRALEKEKQ